MEFLSDLNLQQYVESHMDVIVGGSGRVWCPFEFLMAFSINWPGSTEIRLRVPVGMWPKI